MSTLHFAREPAAAFFAEAMPLLREHWREIAHYQDIPLDPDVDAYIACDQAGALRIYTARDAQGTLAGYAAFFVRRNLHYRSSLQAVQDVLFLHPRHRRGSAGLRLLRWCDAALRDEGVQVVYQHVKRAQDFGALLARLGYEPVETIHAKRLDPWQ